MGYQQQIGGKFFKFYGEWVQPCQILLFENTVTDIRINQDPFFFRCNQKTTLSKPANFNHFDILSYNKFHFRII